MSTATKEARPGVGVWYEPSSDGAVVRVVFEGGRGNVFTTALAQRLVDVLDLAAREPRLRAVVLAAEGSHFSFGASVEEHLPARVREMLTGFHALVRTLLRYPVPVIAAVRGQCLGGGLEVALACGRIVAGIDARLGSPEIRLAVFAPAASALLPDRVSPQVADELLVTGRTVTAAEAALIGLVDQVVDGDPAVYAEEWARSHLVAVPAAAVRLAWRAARSARVEAQCTRIDALERAYLDEAATSAAAIEGLTAFVEKRPPRWSDG